MGLGWAVFAANSVAKRSESSKLTVFLSCYFVEQIQSNFWLEDLDVKIYVTCYWTALFNTFLSEMSARRDLHFLDTVVVVEHLVAQQQHFQEILLLILQHCLPCVNFSFIVKQHIRYSLRLDRPLAWILKLSLACLFLLSLLISLPKACVVHLDWLARPDIILANQSLSAAGDSDHAAVVGNTGKEISDVFFIHKDYLRDVEPIAFT